MTPETFCEQFATFAEAPNGVAKLRELILQLAVQGKLGTQDVNDEPARLWSCATPIEGERERALFWWPEGPKLDSPGQRPGLAIHVSTEALKGRNSIRMRRSFAPSGLQSFVVVPYPGRCPGLSSFAPLGHKTSRRCGCHDHLSGGRP